MHDINDIEWGMLLVALGGVIVGAIILVLILSLPLAGQIKIDPIVKDPVIEAIPVLKVYPVPTDWSMVKRPTLSNAITALKTERTAGECQDCLHISEPGVYQDEKKVIWYAIHHPRIGLVAVQDKTLFTEIARYPQFTDGEHDELWGTNYLDAQIKLGTVRQWREKPAVYDKEGKVLVPAVPLIPADWKPPVDEVK